MYCAYTAQDDWSSTTQFTKMPNEKFTYNATSGWIGSNNITWGHSSVTDKYTFFAYSPYAEAPYIQPSIENGVLKIEYIVHDDITAQEDLLVANPRKNIYPQVAGKVYLQFNHYLSKVSFSVGNPNVMIQSITINGVANSGTLSYNMIFLNGY